jgi:hypothetical protein
VPVCVDVRQFQLRQNALDGICKLSHVRFFHDRQMGPTDVLKPQITSSDGVPAMGGVLGLGNIRRE